jgi:hypothetical protein
VGHVSSTVEVRNAYNILVGKPEGKIPLGRPICKFKVSIKHRYE